MVTYGPQWSVRDSELVYSLALQGGRTWQPFIGGKNGHENFCQARIYNFRDKCVAQRRKNPKLSGPCYLMRVPQRRKNPKLSG